MVKAKRKGGMSGIAKFVVMTQQTSSEVVPVEKAQAKDEEILQVLDESRAPNEDGEPRTKKRNMNATPATGLTEATGWIEKYDASGLVPHYSHVDQVPEHLRKCE